VSETSYIAGAAFSAMAALGADLPLLGRPSKWSRRKLRASQPPRWALAPTTFLPGTQQFQASLGIFSRRRVARSAIYHAEKIKAPVLLLHGGADERIPVRQA